MAVGYHYTQSFCKEILRG
jgi:hypothetical protein